MEIKDSVKKNRETLIQVNKQRKHKRKWKLKTKLITEQRLNSKD